METRQHPKGTTILVLGILGLVIFAPLSVAAWVMGNTALAEIRSAPAGVTYANEGNIRVGRILGIVGTLLLAVVILIIVIAVASVAE